MPGPANGLFATQRTRPAYQLDTGTAHRDDRRLPPINQKNPVMCGAIQLQDTKVFFPHPSAKLPVRKRDGQIEWVTWGKRRDEMCAFPEGGWARLSSIKDGRWTRLNPRPVQIAVERFMEKDAEGQRYWFDLEEGEFIQGLMAFIDGEARVYVVTQEAEAQTAMIHPRWPRILQRDAIDEPARRTENAA